MTDRIEMLKATLDLFEEGVAILDEQSNVLFWNKAAEALTGRVPHEVCERRCPDDLYRINETHQVAAGAEILKPNNQPNGRPKCLRNGNLLLSSDSSNVGPEGGETESGDRLGITPVLVSMSHKLGHAMPIMLRKISLRNSCGVPIGSTLLFYPVEEVDQLPHGEAGEGADIERSQAEMEDRLDAAHHQWTTSHVPFGSLWVSVDQAQMLRMTHGKDACESMLRTVEQTLLRQMKPAEVMGRWGEHEFLLLAHERTAELLREHAQRLTGLARTADFRWWGDRVGLTVSIGSSQATEGDTLNALLCRARQAMHASEYSGGNQVTVARKE